MQLCIPTFRQEKAIKNDVMTAAYHEWYHDMTASYLLLHPDYGVGQAEHTTYDDESICGEWYCLAGHGEFVLLAVICSIAREGCRIDRRLD